MSVRHELYGDIIGRKSDVLGTPGMVKFTTPHGSVVTMGWVWYVRDVRCLEGSSRQRALELIRDARARRRLRNLAPQISAVSDL